MVSEHYYTNNPSVESKPVTFSFELRGKQYRFTSDHGVFSKKEIDFGTRLLLDTFQFPSEKGNIIDVGCGYGPIGITLANEQPDITVHMVDVNERAIALAKQNANQNGVSNIIIKQSSLFESVEERDFQVVITNPPIRAGKQVVHALYEQAFHHLKKGGQLWVVIQKKQGAPSTIEKLQEHFGEVETVVKKKGYFIICAKKV